MLPPMPGSAESDQTQMLLGAPAAPAPVSAPQPAPDQAVAGVMSQIRDLHMAVESLSRQFPMSAEPARAVQDGLKNMMVTIVAQIGSNESYAQPTPRII